MPDSNTDATNAAAIGAVLAFVGDADTRERIEAELSDAPLTAVEGGTQAALAVAEWPADLGVVIVDIADSTSPVEDAAALAMSLPPRAVAICVGDANDVTLYRDLLGAGMADYMVRPLGDGVVRKSVDAALAAKAREWELREAKEKLSLVASGALAVQDQDATPAKVIACVGARGGVGCTTVAVSLAAMMAKAEAHETLVLDLDLHFGSVMLALDLDPTDALRDALAMPERVDNLFIDQAVQRKGERLFALGAEDAPPTGEPPRYEQGIVSQLMTKFQRRFRTIVIDVPRGDPVLQRQALEAATHVVLVVEPSLAGARDGMRLMDHVHSVAPSAKLLLTCSGAVDPKRATVKLAELEKSLKQKLDARIAFDDKSVASAIGAGKPVPDMAARGLLAKSLEPLVKTIIGDGAQTRKGGAPSGAGIFAKLFGGKPKAPPARPAAQGA
ncbi:MAG: AAA family ATPase [Rhodospirillales bacterium]|nr:MAG: AAA family ATPase [Rhodospirillales bacterium]